MPPPLAVRVNGFAVCWTSVELRTNEVGLKVIGSSPPVTQVTDDSSDGVGPVVLPSQFWRW